MNVKMLELGKTYKNYKHLCEILEEQIKAGNAKKAQLKMWEGYFSHSKDGNKFIITEIFDNPVEKPIIRGGANNMLRHAPLMDAKSMSIIDNHEGNELLLTMTRLLLQMNMINENFSYGNQNRNKVSNYLNIEEAFIEEFFNTSKRTFKSNIESMLNRLESRALIFWQKVITVCIATATNEKDDLGRIKVNTEILVDEFGNEHVDLSTDTKAKLEYRLANKEEILLIKEVEGLVMDDLGCENKQEIIVKEMWKLFIKRVNKILLERANILYYYDSYKIIKNEKRLARETKKVEPYIEEFDISNDTELLDLNKEVQSQLLKNWERRHAKAIIKNKGANLSIRKSEEYVKNGDILIGSFINTDHEPIVDELKQIKTSKMYG